MNGYNIRAYHDFSEDVIGSLKFLPEKLYINSPWGKDLIDIIKI